jgi:hypothetical protein
MSQRLDGKKIMTVKMMKLDKYLGNLMKKYDDNDGDS